MNKISVIGVGDIMPGGLLTGSPNPCANEDVVNLLLQGILLKYI